MKILVSLPAQVIEALDILASEVDATRSAVISDLLEYVVMTKEGRDVVDDIYPEEAESESESEEGEESEAEAEESEESEETEESTEDLEED